MGRELKKDLGWIVHGVGFNPLAGCYRTMQ